MLCWWILRSCLLFHYFKLCFCEYPYTESFSHMRAGLWDRCLQGTWWWADAWIMLTDLAKLFSLKMKIAYREPVSVHPCQHSVLLNFLILIYLIIKVVSLFILMCISLATKEEVFICMYHPLLLNFLWIACLHTLPSFIF